MKDEHFVNGVYKLRIDNKGTSLEILNWYRNLYFRESNTTERGIIANVINNLFMDINKLNMLDELKFLGQLRVESYESYQYYKHLNDNQKGERLC